MKQGDCDTCGHSIGNYCQQGLDGIRWSESDSPLPCPVWTAQGPDYEARLDAWYRRNPWPFKTT